MFSRYKSAATIPTAAATVAPWTPARAPSPLLPLSLMKSNPSRAYPSLSTVANLFPSWSSSLASKVCTASGERLVVVLDGLDDFTGVPFVGVAALKRQVGGNFPASTIAIVAAEDRAEPEFEGAGVGLTEASPVASHETEMGFVRSSFFSVEGPVSWKAWVAGKMMAA